MPLDHVTHTHKHKRSSVKAFGACFPCSFCNFSFLFFFAYVYVCGAIFAPYCRPWSGGLQLFSGHRRKEPNGTNSSHSPNSWSTAAGIAVARVRVRVEQHEKLFKSCHQKSFPKRGINSCRRFSQGM